MLEHSKLLLIFDKALNQATSIAIKNGDPITRSKNSVFIGSTIVEKNENNFYDVKSIDKTILYGNLSTFDVALIVAQRYNSREFKIIKQVLTLEEKYSKHHNDMMHYLHCFKSAKKKKDVEKMCILEDKFQISESLAKISKDKIISFKRMKALQN